MAISEIFCILKEPSEIMEQTGCIYSLCARWEDLRILNAEARTRDDIRVLVAGLKDVVT